MSSPLADRIRPATLDDVVGQHHLLDEGRMLRKIIENKNIPNLIFYGPSGVGKTTVARIIAASSGKTLYKLNGTTASVSDIKEIIAGTNTLTGVGGVLLYLDEIQYLNKKQQQSLLEYIEDGSITLIASTTENPYFYIYGAILSRCTVMEFKPVESEDIKIAVNRAFNKFAEQKNTAFDIEDGVADYIAATCGGDVRKAINCAEVLSISAALTGEKGVITLDDATQLSAKSAMRYDRDGDSHYDILSAFQKSIRGSDPDAALHYLARLFRSGRYHFAQPKAYGYCKRGCGACLPAGGGDC